MSGPSIRLTPLSYEPYKYSTSETLRLPCVTAVNTERAFIEVFSSRRSTKLLGECPIEQLSFILQNAFKPYFIGVDDYGVTVYRSAAPSAGGRHPIDLLIGLPKDGCRQLYVYNPIGNSLERLNIPMEKQQTFFADVDNTLSLNNSVLLWFSLQPLKTASKYTEHESLIWRDVGAQLCCLQQVSEYVGMGSCPIGYLAEETFSAMFGTDAVKSGGGLIIGDKIQKE